MPFRIKIEIEQLIGEPTYFPLFCSPCHEIFFEPIDLKDELKSFSNKLSHMTKFQAISPTHMTNNKKKMRKPSHEHEQ